MFQILSLGIISIFGFLYFIYYNKDFSESVSISLGAYILWAYFGISDLLFFWFQGQSVPLSLSWLNNNVGLSFISKIFGFEGVTNISLYASVVLGFIAIFFLTKFLKEKL